MPETSVIQESPRLIRLVRRSFLQAGQDGFTKPPSQDPDLFELVENILPSIDGPIRKRWGMTQFSDTVSLVAQIIQEYRTDDGTKVRLLLSGTEGATRKVKTCDASGAVQNTGVWTVSSTTDNPRAVVSRDYAYFTSGSDNDRVKYDGNDTTGNGVTTWGLLAPVTAPAAASSGTGTITITAFRDYTVAFMNTTTGHISDIGPFIRVEKFSNKAQIDLTSVPLADATIGGVNTGVNQRLILATSDGGPRTHLYLVGTIADNTVTTFTDTVSEATLLTKDIYVEIGDDGLRHGIIDNSRPTSGKYPLKHRGRLFMLVNRKLRFSKSLEEISTSSGFEIGGKYEEAWPADYEIDVSSVAQDPVGLLSDGAFLYVLAKSGLYRIAGDGPLTFRPPELVFRYVGVQSQDTEDIVYRGGVPVGMLWVTPAKQIIFSDTNTYNNITWPMKLEMDAIPEAYLSNARVKYGGYEGYNLAFIAVPETTSNIPTLLLIYNLDTGQLVRWRFPASQQITAMHFWNNPTTSLPQILWCNADGTMFRFDVSATQDRTSADALTSFTSSLTGAWLDFGAPHVRKFLQELEVDGSNLSISIDAASKSSEFDSPASIVSAASVTTSPFGEDKIYLAGKNTKDRFYRLKFSISADVLSSVAVLRSYYFAAVPLHSL